MPHSSSLASDGSECSGSDSDSDAEFFIKEILLSPTILLAAAHGCAAMLHRSCSERVVSESVGCRGSVVGRVWRYERASYLLSHADTITPRRFRQNFRVPRPVFQRLLGDLGAELQPHSTNKLGKLTY